MNCNLNCKGCYAGSSTRTDASLPYEVINRILNEKLELWGSHFTVISGGEPFIYRDGKKTFIDVLRDHHADTRAIIDKMGARPLDKFAAKAMEDPTYYKGMVEYGRVIEEISRDIWEKEYLDPERNASDNNQ